MAFSHPKFLKPASELPDGRIGSPFDGRTGIRTFQKKFQIIATTKNADVVDCCFGPGIPRPYSPYYSYDRGFTDELALLIKLNAQQDNEDWQKWVVTCDYSTDIGAKAVFPTNDGANPTDPTSAANNPEYQPPEYSWDEETEMITPLIDLGNKPITNSTGDPYRPGPSFPVSSPVFQMTRYERFFPPTLITQYNFVTNSDIFMGAPPGYVMSYPIKASQVAFGKHRLWRATYRWKFHWMLDGDLRQFLFPQQNNADAVLHNDNPFQPYVLDAGYRYLVDEVKAGVNIKVPREFTPRPPEPELLNGRGGKARINPKTGQKTPRYRYFRVYRSKPFAKLFQNFNFNG